MHNDLNARQFRHEKVTLFANETKRLKETIIKTSKINRTNKHIFSTTTLQKSYCVLFARIVWKYYSTRSFYTF